MYRKLTRFAISGLLTLGTCEYCTAQTAWRWQASTAASAKSSGSSARLKPAPTAGGAGSSQAIGPIGELDWHQLPEVSQGSAVSQDTPSPAPVALGNDLFGSQAANQSPTGNPFRFPRGARSPVDAGEARRVDWDALPRNAIQPAWAMRARETSPAAIPWDPRLSQPRPSMAGAPTALPPTTTQHSEPEDQPRVDEFHMESMIPASLDRTAPIAVTQGGGRGLIGPVDEMPSDALAQTPPAAPVPVGQAPDVQAPATLGPVVQVPVQVASVQVATAPYVQPPAVQSVVEQPAPLPEPTSFGLIESYLPAESEEEAFSLPPVEQIIGPEMTASQVDSVSATQDTPDDGDVEERLAGDMPSLIPMNLLPMGSVSEAAVSPSDRLASMPNPSITPDPQAEPSTYVLQNLRGEAEAEPIAEMIIPIDVLPLSRLTETQPLSAQAALTTAQMTGPLTDAATLFGKLNIENDYRQIPKESAPVTRIDADASGMGPEWLRQEYAWVTPTFYHRPLYFEQENLERYGIGPNRYVQPVYSAAHFFLSVGLMPYKLTTQHPCEKVYTLGHNRPGDCVPYQQRTLLGQSYPLEACRYFESYSSYR